MARRPSDNVNPPPGSPDAGSGVLYVVATPIGNPDDITLRALKVLSAVDLVAAEDTRAAGRLLAAHGIHTKRISYFEHNEDKRAPELLAMLAEGRSIALVSTAGTPLISDPGYRLVMLAAAQGIPVKPVPGPCAATAALSAAGLPTDAFLFLGFPTRKKERRRRDLEGVAHEPRTLVFYESPRRVLTLLADVLSVLGDRDAVLCREITKPYEEFLRGPVSEILAALEARGEVKGECVLILRGRTGADDPWEAALHRLGEQMEEGDKPFSGLVRAVAKEFGLPRGRLYDRALSLKKGLEGGGDADE